MTLLLFGVVTGCNQSAAKPAADYRSYWPPKGHWAIELKTTDAAEVSQAAVHDAIQSTDGIISDSVVVNMDAGYASFRPSQSGPGAAVGAKEAVSEALSKLGVEVGASKTIN